MDFVIFKDIFEKFGYRLYGKNMFYRHHNAEVQGIIFQKICCGRQFRPIFFQVPYLFEEKIKQGVSQLELRLLATCGLNYRLEESYEVNEFSEIERQKICRELEETILPFMETFSITNEFFWDMYIEIPEGDGLDCYSSDDIFHSALIEIKYKQNYDKATRLMQFVKKRFRKMADREQRLLTALVALQDEEKRCAVNEIIREVEMNFLSNNRILK